MAYAGKRFLIAILGFFGFALTYLFDTTFENASSENLSRSASFSVLQLVMMFFQILYPFAAFFGGIVATRYGGASTFGIAIFLQGATYLICVYLNVGFGIFVILRCISIFANGIALCAIVDVWARWFPVEQRYKAASFTIAAQYFALIALTQSENLFRKKSIFVFIGGASMIWAAIWLFFVKNDPAEDKLLNARERQYLIQKIDIADKERNNMNTYPWRSVLTSRSVWILCIITFIFNIGTVTTVSLLKNAPRYNYLFNNFSVNWGIFFFWTSFLFCLPAGFIVDFVRSKKPYAQAPKIFICAGLLVLAVMCVLISFTKYLDIATLFLLILLISKIFVEVVLVASAIDLSPKYAALVYGIQLTFSSIGIRVVSLYVMQQNRPEKAIRTLFIPTIVLFILGASLYRIWGSGKRQSWDPPRKPEYELQGGGDSNMA